MSDVFPKELAEELALSANSNITIAFPSGRIAPSSDSIGTDNESTSVESAFASVDSFITVEIGASSIPGPPGAPGPAGPTAFYVGDEEPDDTDVLWVDTDAESEAFALKHLADVEIVSPHHQDILSYDSASNTWVNVPMIEDGLDDIHFEGLPAETIVTYDERMGHDLRWWADGTFGFFDAATSILSASANGPDTTIIMHDYYTGGIAHVVGASTPLSGKIEPSGHASGGPVFVSWKYQQSGDNLMIYHGENYSPAPHTLSHLGLATLTEDGITDLGKILEPTVSLENLQNHVDVMSGAFAVHDGYVYVYFRDSLDGLSVTSLSVARTPLEDMFECANTGVLPEFTKYANSGWSEPGLGGGKADDLLPSTVGYLAWCSISYVEKVGAHLFVYSVATDGLEVQARWTFDCINFSDPIVLIPNSPIERWYVTIAPPASSPNFLQERIRGDAFDLYVTASNFPGGDRWSDAWLERWSFDISTVQARLDNLIESAVGYVNHGADAGMERLSGFKMVIWRGSVEPENMTADDM